MDWVHCNVCFQQPANGRRFYLSNCAHIFCEECQRQCKEKCKVCEQKCNLIQLSNPLSPNVAPFFSEPMQLFQKYREELRQVIEFQKGHRQRYQSYLIEKNMKCMDAAQRMSQQMTELENRLSQQITELRHELQQRQQHIEYLERVIRAGPNQPSPAQGVGIPPGVGLPRRETGVQRAVFTPTIHLQAGQNVGSPSPRAGQRSGFPSQGHMSNRLSICSPPVNGRIAGYTPNSGGSTQETTLTPSPHALAAFGTQQLTSSGMTTPRSSNKGPNHHDIQLSSLANQERFQRHYSPGCQRFSPFSKSPNATISYNKDRPMAHIGNRSTPSVTPTNLTSASIGSLGRQDLRSYLSSRLTAVTPQSRP